MAENQVKQIESMTCAELRTELKRHGCSTSGNKKELIVKLRAAIEESSKNESSVNDAVDNTQIEMSTAQSSSLVQDQTFSDSSSTTKVSERETEVSVNQSAVDDVSSDQTSNSASAEQTLDKSSNVSNGEVKSFVSKSIEEKQENIEKLGGESYPSSVGSTSAKSESIIKETQLSDEQQRADQLNSEQQQDNQICKTNEETKSAEPDKSILIKNPCEIIDEQTSNNDLSADLKTRTEQTQKATTDESSNIDKPIEQAAERHEQTSSHPQTSSTLIKGFVRSTNNKINLSSELLRTFIPDMSLLSESTVNDDLDAQINDQTIDNSTTDNDLSMNESVLETSTINDLLSDSMTIGELADQKLQVTRTVVMNVPVNTASLSTATYDDNTAKRKANPTTSYVPAFESRISIDEKINTVVTDEPIRIVNVTPIDGPSSEILHIRGLTRPFSLLQLKSLLSRYGTLVETQFWLNKIKSECLTKYNTIQQAQTAREALDGCRWPSTNPKTLSVRFAQENELELCKTRDLLSDRTITNRNTTSRTIEQEKPDEVSQQQSNNLPMENARANTTKTNTDIREWDIPKLKEKAQNQVRTSEEKQLVKPKKTAPAKGLDDYFRKTKSQPSIYWLPSTEEQVTERVRDLERRKTESEANRKRAKDENDRTSNSKLYHQSPSRREKRKYSSSSPQRSIKRR